MPIPSRFEHRSEWRLVTSRLAVYSPGVVAVPRVAVAEGRPEVGTAAKGLYDLIKLIQRKTDATDKRVLLVAHSIGD